MVIIKRELDLNDPALRKSMTDMLKSLEGKEDFEAVVKGMIDECVYDPYGMCALRDGIESLAGEEPSEVFCRLLDYADDTTVQKMEVSGRAVIARHSLGVPIGDALDKEFLNPGSLFTCGPDPDESYLNQLLWMEFRGPDPLDEWMAEMYTDFYGKPEFDDFFAAVKSRYNFYKGCRTDVATSKFAVYDKYVKASKRYKENF